MQIKDNSPSSGLPIEPMLDFLIYPPPESDLSYPEFSKYIESNEDKEIELTFFNIANQNFHKCKLTPRKWEGEGLLGFIVNEGNYKEAHTNVIHILEFYVDSPLYKAGFKPNTDYILSTEHYSFVDDNDFMQFIKANEKKPLNIYVYSSETEKIRMLTLTPDSNWGGSGSLGGDIGYGNLHSLPTRRKHEEQEITKSENKTNEVKSLEVNSSETTI